MKTLAYSRSFIFLVIQLLLLSASHAILDQNSNGLSDLWEKQQNNGNLFPNSFLASADEDKDGWSNAKEAIAGTDPFEANPTDGIVAVTLTPSLVAAAYTLTWPTLLGKNYQLEASTDLLNWFAVGTPITTIQSTHSFGINTTQPDNSIPPKVLWRVKVTDLDTDLDGLTNSEEHSLGTNHFLDDTDGDTLKDKAEILAGTSPLDEDTDEDGLNDNLDATQLSNDAIADPDGANLAAHLNNYTTETNGVKLIARYDFEAIPTINNYDFASSVPNIPGASADDVGLDRFANPSGMPSFCCQWNSSPTTNEYLSLPYQILENRTSHAWSYWLKLPKNAFVASAQNAGIRSLLSIGIDHNAASIPGSSSPLPALHWYCDITAGTIRAETYQNQIGTANMLGSGWNIPAAWNDGEWHHIVFSKSDTKYNIYFDGVELGEKTSNNINLPLSSNSYTLIGLRDLTATTLTNVSYRFPEGSRLDRLRCYTKLTLADAQALYNQDIDRDGLYDRTESRQRLWQDYNQNALREATESDYILRPFHHDSTTSDHDKDGITSHNEQNGPIISDPGNFDTDGDLLPDGWEKLHNFPYHIPGGTADTHLDGDSDGADNFKEYLAGSNPHNAHSDTDGVNDGIEINQRSDANDASDQGLPPDSQQTYSLLLGIGDDSENQDQTYELVASEYDWTTGGEKEIFRLLAHGNHVLNTIDGFYTYASYTFRAEKRGVIHAYNEQSDNDYCFTVEPTDNSGLTSVHEVHDLTNLAPAEGYVLGEQAYSPVATEAKRAILQPLRVDLAVDTDMDRIFESLYLKFSSGSQYGPDSSKQDRELLDNDPQRAVIIDVNNNNSDSKTPSTGSAVVDNANNTLDGAVDKTEITASATGHSFGNIRLWCWPNENFGIPWFGKPAKYQLKLSYADAAHANYVRVFAATGVTNDNQKPVMYLGPGKTEHFIDPVEFFTETPFKQPTATNAYRNLVAEGITYGTATIKLEIIDIATNTAVGQPQIVRISTNVDRLEQLPAFVANTKDAVHLRGVTPHHFGMRKQNQSTAGIRALRGKLTIKIPSTTSAHNTQLTPMRSKFLKRQISDLEQTDSGASFWIGLKQNNPDGSPAQWVQTGVRWVQPTDQKIASPPGLYLETGDTFGNLGANSFTQETINTNLAAWLTGGGVSNNANSILSNWNNRVLEMDFVLFKSISPNEEDSNANPIPWVAIFKDSAGNYLLMKKTNAPPEGTVGTQNKNELERRYRTQSFKDIDCLFEANNSIAFTVGSSQEQSSFSNLQYAVSYVAQHGAEPGSSNKAGLFAWASETFSWENTEFDGSTAEVKTGRLNGTNAQNGSHPHPYWQKTNTATSLTIWDLRNYAFGVAP